MFRTTKNFCRQTITNPSWVLKSLLLPAAFLWTVMIAVLCLIDANELPKPELDISSPDKYVHFTFHFMFTLLWITYGRMKWRNVLMKVFTASLVFGILIEICQEFFTTTRSADISDVLANVSGSLVAIILLRVFGKHRRNQRNI